MRIVKNKRNIFRNHIREWIKHIQFGIGIGIVIAFGIKIGIGIAIAIETHPSPNNLTGSTGCTGFF